MSAKYLLASFGCKVNQYESQQLRETLESLGMRPVRRGETPHLSIINTCAVTSAAESKGRQSAPRLSIGGTTPVVGVGCGATTKAESWRQSAHVAVVVGHDTDAIAELRRFVLDRLERTLNRLGNHQRLHAAPGRTTAECEPEDDGWMITSGVNTPNTPDDSTASYESSQDNMDRALPLVNTPQLLSGRIEQYKGHPRAFRKVKDGCDACCSHCLIPQLRPNLRSKPVKVAGAEARSLLPVGFREHFITGILLVAHGRQLAIRKRFHKVAALLGQLMHELVKLKGLRRPKQSSLGPGDINDSVSEALASRRC